MIPARSTIIVGVRLLHDVCIIILHRGVCAKSCAVSTCGRLPPVQDLESVSNGIAARAPSESQQQGALIPRPKTPDGTKRGGSSALACFGGGKVL